MKADSEPAIAFSGAGAGLCFTQKDPYHAALQPSLHNWFLFRFILITLQKYIFHQIESLSSLQPWKGLDSITSDISNSKLWTWKKHFKAWLCEASSAQAE